VTCRQTTRSRIVNITLLAIVAIALSGCSTNDGRDMSPPRDDQTDTITQTTAATTLDPTQDAVTEPATFLSVSGSWDEGGMIAAKHTCAGSGVAPALSWTGVGEGAKSLGFALSESDDPENVLWVVTNLEATLAGIAEGEPLPATAVVAKNSRGATGYTAPCPDTTEGTSYLLTLYALDQVIEAETGDDATTVLAAMESAALDATSSEFVARGA